MTITNRQCRSLAAKLEEAAGKLEVGCIRYGTQRRQRQRPSAMSAWNALATVHVVGVRWFNAERGNRS